MDASNDPVLLFTTVLLIILLAPIIVSRLRVPGMIGLILAGAILGPHALGFMQRDAAISLLGTIGLLFIMFIAGLSLDLNQFNRNRRHGLLFGLLTFMLPMGFGVAMGRLMMGYNWPVSILLGSVFSSHTLLPYQLVSRLGLARHRAVTAAIGGTLFTDIGAMLVLAVVAASADQAIGGTFWLRLIFLTVAYFVLTLYLVPIVGRWFLRKVAENGEVEFVFVLVVLFVCASCSKLVGLEPIIGAFLAGIALNRLIPDGSTLMNRIHFVGNALFIPFFLIATGMILDPGVLRHRAAWAVTLTMLGIIYLTKWLAAWLGAKTLKFSRDEGMMMFGLSINQAAATLAAVIVGHRLGLFDENLLTGTIVMIAVTCLSGPLITDYYARRIALEAESDPGAEELPQRIMVAIANPENVGRLMELGMLMRNRNSREPLYPLSVVQDGEDSERILAGAEKIIAQASEQAVAAAVPTLPVTRLETNIADGILSAMKDFRASTLIAGWNGKSPGLGETYGRVLDEVVLRSRQTLLVGRIEASLTGTRTMVLAIPPLAERHVGFTNTIHTAKVIASQLGTPLRIVACQDHLNDLREIIGATLPDIPVFYQDLIPQWRNLPAQLHQMLTPHDFVVLLSLRYGELAWHPSFDSLPTVIAEAFPKANFAVLYPPLIKISGMSSEPTASVAPEAVQVLMPNRVRLDLDGLDLEQALLALLQDRFPQDSAAFPEIAETIAKMVQEGPMELSEKVLMLHAHVTAIDNSAVFIGLNQAGFKAGEKAFPVLILILSQRGGKPELHLRMLSEIVKLVKCGAVAKLQSAKSPEEFVNSF